MAGLRHFGGKHTPATKRTFHAGLQVASMGMARRQSMARKSGQRFSENEMRPKLTPQRFPLR
jgi:hypothetical protein